MVSIFAPFRTLYVRVTDTLHHGQIQKTPSWGGEVLTKQRFFSHQRISQRAVRASLEKQLDPKGPVGSREKPYTNIFQETYSHLWYSSGIGVRTPMPPLGPPMFTFRLCYKCRFLNYMTSFFLGRISWGRHAGSFAWKINGSEYIKW